MNSKIKILSTKKSTVIAGIILALVILFFIIRAIVSACSAPVVAFYDIAGSTQKVLQTTVEEYAKNNGLKFKYEILSTDKSLKNAISIGKKPALLFTTSGAPLKAAVKAQNSNALLPPSLVSEMTSSMGDLVPEKKGGLAAVPVLSDNMEIDINKPAFLSSKMGSISTWKDIENFTRKQTLTNEHPMIFAGKDSEFVIDLFGALTEAYDGRDGYEKAAKIIQNASARKFDAVQTAELLAASYNSPLYTALSTLAGWYKAGLLNGDSFALTADDIGAYLRTGLAQTAFMTLQQHRNLDSDAVRNFSSIYFPSDSQAVDRNFTAPVIFALQLKKNQAAAKTISALVSVPVQEKLSASTGLAPVLSHCRTPDRQADDARYWVAATKAPLPGLSREADLSMMQKSQLAEELLAKVKNFKN